MKNFKIGDWVVDELGIMPVGSSSEYIKPELPVQIYEEPRSDGLVKVKYGGRMGSFIYWARTENLKPAFKEGKKNNA